MRGVKSVIAAIAVEPDILKVSGMDDHPEVSVLLRHIIGTRDAFRPSESETNGLPDTP